jgi:hypothetical protein
VNQRDQLREAFDRLPELVADAADGLTPDELRWTPTPEANSVGWLLWHLARIQDSHVAELLDRPEVWTSHEWPVRFGLKPGYSATGYGHTAAEVAAVRPHSARVLLDYYDAVARTTHELLDHSAPADFDRVVDYQWDPPVTLAVRLISVLADDLQHVGQAAYVRGLLGK